MGGQEARGAAVSEPRVGILPCLLRAVATLGPVGRLPVAPGTAGSLVALLAWLALAPPAGWVLWAVLAGIALLGVAAAGEAARVEGTADPQQVVIDEVVGMALALALAPGGLAAGIAAFVAFRAFDIAKPFPAGRLERLPGGWGIVADDVAAGLYAAAAVRLLWLLPGLMRSFR